MRKWSVYERNQLLKYGIDENDLDKFGEMPVEYITGRAEFDGLDFEVSQDVLIPRVETVQMVEVAEKYLADRSDVVFAEIGTGCGAIGICLYLRYKAQGKRQKVVLADVSKEALVVAKKNLKNLVGENKDIEILESDLMAKVDEQIKFDLILANLPYIPTSRVPRLPESVVNFEPHIALDGGIDGLKLLKKLMIQAKNRLKEDGALILEMDYSHDISDFVDIDGYGYEIVQDEFGQNRFLVVRPEQKA